MAQLIKVYRVSDHQFERRQLPLYVDEIQPLIIEFADCCNDSNCSPLGKQKEMDRFVQRFNALTSDQIAVALMATSKEILNLLTNMVSCVGCRRSVEEMFKKLTKTGYPALEPLVVTKESVLSIKRDFLFDPKAIYGLFYVHGPHLKNILESMIKNHKTKRCSLHSLDSHKATNRLQSNWKDAWRVMNSECQLEVLIIQYDRLLETVENYLQKHRFCSECKTKVIRAYHILVEQQPVKEKEYRKALYEGLRCCPTEQHIHVPTDYAYMEKLLSRVEPDMLGSRRERHAKTLDAAQEEVLACIGVHLNDRLQKIWQSMRAEEQTWQILFIVGVAALKKNFEVALENHQGVSNLELVCQQLLEEEKVKEQKRQQKRQKQKQKKKNKVLKSESGQQLEPQQAEEEEREEMQGHENEAVERKSDKQNDHQPFAPSCECNDINKNVSSSCSGHQPKHYGPVAATCNLATRPPCTCEERQSLSLANAGGKGLAGGTIISGSPREHHTSAGTSSCSRSDCGYSSGQDGCCETSCSCSAANSNNGSDIGCNDAGCSHSEGGGESPALKRVTCDCRPCQNSSPPQTYSAHHLHGGLGKYERERDYAHRLPVNYSKHAENENDLALSFGMGLSLKDMLEEACCSDHSNEDSHGEDSSWISEEEILKFKANESTLNTQRQELRERLRQRFAHMQESRVMCGTCLCQMRVAKQGAKTGASE